jgi:hypothetical protein
MPNVDSAVPSLTFYPCRHLYPLLVSPPLNARSLSSLALPHFELAKRFSEQPVVGQPHVAAGPGFSRKRGRAGPPPHLASGCASRETRRAGLPPQSFLTRLAGDTGGRSSARAPRPVIEQVKGMLIEEDHITAAWASTVPPSAYRDLLVADHP